MSWLDVGLSSTISLSIHCAYFSDFWCFSISFFFRSLFACCFFCVCVLLHSNFPVLWIPRRIFFSSSFILCARSIFVMSLEVILSIECWIHHFSTIAQFVWVAWLHQRKQRNWFFVSLNFCQSEKEKKQTTGVFLGSFLFCFLDYFNFKLSYSSCFSHQHEKNGEKQHAFSFNYSPIQRMERNKRTKLNQQKKLITSVKRRIKLNALRLSMSEHDINIVASRVWVMHSTRRNKKDKKKKLRKESNVCVKQSKMKKKNFEFYQNVCTTLWIFSMFLPKWEMMRCASAEENNAANELAKGKNSQVDVFFFSFSGVYLMYLVCEQYFASCSRCYRNDLIKN